MDSQIKRLYEGMFVLPQSYVREDQQAAFDMLNALFQKFGVEVKYLDIWAERSLAFEINHVREATYVLTYFECSPDVIAKIERAVHISDNILRCLLVKPAPGFNLEEYIENAGKEEETTVSVPAAPSVEELDTEEVK